ncbi:Bax inhibitor-1/YccA family protein [Undibacterium umbellatum]|uniref:Bax inhibitor-1/YccA family protein n=1 Tax=Undibacterium umbellatum TaxID=2762300 RepID=A0ABR6ZB46_9BURK|nr:Bax inhibitor-1/YccA family protein [Undibacterium umbellatum]MBC3908967.1 Bax inhibitor-1/YccA family protein [Undibacterium umbellatum]
MKILSRSAHDAQTVAYVDGNTSASHKVLRNTYMLLSMTLLFSAMTAGATIAFNIPGPGILLTLVGYFGLLFATTKLRNSGWGIAAVFALTGFMGYTLGPILTRYLGMPGGTGIVMTAMAMTGVIFMGLSAYVLISKRDFSFMGGFLMVGMLVAFVASLGAIFFQIPALSLTISAVMVLLMSGMILFETSNIIRGGETNYIMATVSLYVTIFNLFTSLLHLLGFIEKE